MKQLPHFCQFTSLGDTNMQLFTLVTLALCIAHTFANELPGCDQDIIDSIREYWDENGTPENVMDTLAKNGIGTLLYSSEVVPVKIPVDDPKCVKGEFTKKTAKFTVVPSKGRLSAAKASVSYKVTEEDGIITENGGKVTKYIIFNENGLTGFYSCNPKGDSSDGTPAVGLAVAVKKIKSAKKYITKSKKILEKTFGFDLQTTYDKECAK